MLGRTIVTKQSGSAEKPVNTPFWVEMKLNYFTIMMDQSSQGPMVTAYAERWISIENLVQSHPRKIDKVSIDITKGPIRRPNQ